MTMLRWVRAALVGVALAAASPVYAQAPGFFTGDDDDFLGNWPSPCVELTDRQIRNFVSQQGFSNIFLNARSDQAIQVRATQGKWVYLLQVSICTGSILYGQRLRPA